MDPLRLAVEEANAGGQAPPVELIIYDDTTNEDRGREIARQVAASGALVVVGPGNTPMALAVAPLYTELGLVSIGGTVTGDSVTDNAALFFRATYSTSENGEMLGNYLSHVLGGTRAIVLAKDDGSETDARLSANAGDRRSSCRN